MEKKKPAEQAEAMREEILRLEQENSKLKDELAALRGARKESENA